MNLNQLNWMNDGLEKVALALSEMYDDSVLPIDILYAISHLVEADDFDKIANYIGDC